MQATEQEIRAMVGGLWIDARMLSQRLEGLQRRLDLTETQLDAARQEIRLLRKQQPEQEPRYGDDPGQEPE